ncbi:nucleoside deaminase [Nocardia cerradoensis]|uniref:nucleoside deaminase n=1 Tax=Nocardia cerradoensis TaxID=85688 RepID=UPI0002F16B2F|nr:nucleoside deaminase [Nocardia cerradoensis]NKY44870.1 nucleoside deaminase [Nocardia cerradoensis]
MQHDNDHLRRAIALGEEAGRRGNRPFGAVIVAADGTTVAEGRNEVAASGVVTAHAELGALTAAGPSADLVGATVYAGGEPCPMCSAALVWAGVARIVFAAAEADFAAIIGGHPRFALGCAEVVGASDAEIAVSGPHLGEEALVPFRRYAETAGPTP